MSAEPAWPQNGYPEGFPIAQTPADLRVGVVAFAFDMNRRVYRPAPAGRMSSGGPLYRHHFFPVVIAGETRMSWLTTHYGKYKKAGTAARLCSLSEVDDAVWTNEHRFKVADMVRYVDAATLRKIAALAGYSPPLTEDHP